MMEALIPAFSRVDSCAATGGSGELSLRFLRFGLEENP